ncbi:MAG: DpnI domain-containing protein [Nanoarchaeota archaeon]
MNLLLYRKEIFQNYKSNSQRARVMTENWFSSKMYCPCCLNKKIINYPNNKKASDFFCKNCNNNFQLKSSKKPFGKKIVDGEFNTMVSVIEKDDSPNFFILEYSSDEWIVKSLIMIPKFFITFSMLEKRKPLSQDARRAGWTGCNFLLDKLPNEGKISIINKEKIEDKDKVNKIWKKMFFLANKKPHFRGWTSDVLKIVQEQNKLFKLNEIYKYENYFRKLHPENKNIQAKIRQQLQILRDNKIIKFKERGLYEVLE